MSLSAMRNVRLSVCGTNVGLSIVPRTMASAAATGSARRSANGVGSTPRCWRRNKASS